MCDVAKYSKMYKDIKNLQPEDTLQLVLESKTKDEKEFFELIGNYLLQKKQKEVIEGKLELMGQESQHCTRRLIHLKILNELISMR